MANGLNPLPSLLRASARDAACQQMRTAGRKRWNDADHNLAVDTLDRLVTACYGRDGDNDPGYAYLRFQAAERLERAGALGLRTTPAAFQHLIADAA